MNDRDDVDLCFIGKRIDSKIRQARYRKLTGLLYFSNSAQKRKILQNGDGLPDPRNNTACSTRTALRNIFLNRLKISFKVWREINLQTKPLHNDMLGNTLFRVRL
ncbi:MAG: hypothetical protein L3J67_03450 [Hyphomicrobiaceae bacterium]|nr:hypothetical protein [Hyphomicrobiaceae bacterium]